MQTETKFFDFYTENMANKGLTSFVGGIYYRPKFGPLLEKEGSGRCGET